MKNKIIMMAFLLTGLIFSASAGPLHDAAIRGDVTEMRRLLEEKSDVNSRDEDGWTALHFAAQGGRVEAVRLLLCNGAEIDAQSSKTGNTALMYAARDGNSGSEEVVKLLLERGADINLREWQMGGHTALSLAQWRGLCN